MENSYHRMVLSHWQSFLTKITAEVNDPPVDGRCLDLASVVAVSRYGIRTTLSESALQAVAKSAQILQDSIRKGEVIYGVNTGFGGNADTRTVAVEELQRNLLRGLQYGIIARPVSPSSHGTSAASCEKTPALQSRHIPLDDPLAATCMPESWVRASMLVRLNSIASGVSGVRVCTIETLMKLLAHNITPQIPIRGSISASGDLSPLSYIGGVMQGKPTIMAYAGQRSSGKRRVVRADVALAEAEITPIKLAAKEGLAIVNGTAVSAGVAALALHEAHCQAILAQILTAMSVEGLAGTDESFDPFFAKVRPHMGQRESAFNIQSFLVGSKLVYRNNGLEEASLRQDRYSIRTASQWIGPILEDFQLAHQQVTTELNSVTDNPLLDGERMLHGGNFQAASVRSAMEKVRQGCESLGRMLSVQCTELINPATNRGLPPNLVVDEPSESFIWKGSDIMVAALQSELGFLANPVGSHVQSAEMGNQALNSLALISARYTLDALAVLTQLSSVHLIALCQALDLRVMNTQYLAGLQKTFIDETRQAYVGLDQDTRWLDQCETELWKAFETLFSQTMGRDSTTRFQFVMRSLQPIVLKSAPPTTETVMAIHAWTQRCSEVALEQYILHRGSYVNHPDATGHIGPAAGRLYNFVRKHLRIPFLQEDGMRTPEPELLEPSTGPSKDGLPDMNTNGGTEKTTMNAIMAKVYQSMRSGELYVAVMETLQDAIHHHNGYKA